MRKFLHFLKWRCAVSPAFEESFFCFWRKASSVCGAKLLQLLEKSLSSFWRKFIFTAFWEKQLQLLNKKASPTFSSSFWRKTSPAAFGEKLLQFYIDFFFQSLPMLWKEVFTDKLSQHLESIFFSFWSNVINFQRKASPSYVEKHFKLLVKSFFSFARKAFPTSGEKFLPILQISLIFSFWKKKTL